MLKMGTPCSIAGPYGPLVFTVNFYTFRSEVQHRFDTQYHPRFKARTASGSGVVGNLRRFVKLYAATVPHILADDGEFAAAGAFPDGRDGNAAG